MENERVSQPHSTPGATSTPGTTNGKPQLWAEHVEILRARAIPAAFALAHGLRSVDLGGMRSQREKLKSPPPWPHLPLPEGATGIAIEYQDTLDGVPRGRVRLDKTEFVRPGPIDGSHHGEHTVGLPRYICQAKPVTVVPYIPPEVFAIAGDTTKPLYVVEAPLKSLSLTANGFPAVGLGGVLAGATDSEVLTALGEIVISKELARVNWAGRVAYVVFDAGISDNPQVALGAARLALGLQRAGADVRFVVLPYFHPTESDPESGNFWARTDQGPDDYVARFGVESFKKLIDVAVPADPIARIAQAAAAPNRTEAVAHLLGELPVQAMIHEGGALVVDQVAVVAKIASVTKRSVQEAARTFAERLARRAQAEDPDWKGSLRRTASGGIAGAVENVLTVLAHDPAWAGVVGYNEFSERVVLRKPAPWDADDAPKFSHIPDTDAVDEDDVRLVAWFGRHYEAKIATAMAHEAIGVVAQRNRFHPVREYLDKLVWDGVERIAGRTSAGWLARYVGTDDTPYTRNVGRWWLISGVARIYQPGCLVKTMLVLVGPQDAKKSQAFFTLGGDWFMDDLRDIHSKDACQQLAGKWIIEFGEMAAWSKADAETGKRFISTRIDNYRPAYGRRNRDFRRQCIFGGTTNTGEFIGDSTGGARFWPVDVGTIDVEALRRDRAQLWAEAVILYKAGEKWWTEDESVLAAVRQEQDGRRKVHPWEAVVAEGLDAGWDETTDDELNVVKVPRPAKNETTTQYVIDCILRIPLAQQTKAVQTVVGEVMHAIGWVRRQRRIGERRVWFYVRRGSEGEGVPTVTTVTTATGGFPGDAGPKKQSSAAIPDCSSSDLGGDSGDGGDTPRKQAADRVTTSQTPGGDGGDRSTVPPADALPSLEDV